jgi:hypothetical protein
MSVTPSAISSVDPGPSNDACNTLRNLKCRSEPSDDFGADLRRGSKLEMPKNLESL